MQEYEICAIVKQFYDAIIAAKADNSFCWHDRMHLFPVGCCDDACDLLSYYLWNNFKIHTDQFSGYYEKEDKYHAWLITDDEVLIDITSGQFLGWKTIYVSSRSQTKYYSIFKQIKHIDGINLEEHRQLWEDYQRIIKYIVSGNKE